MICFSNFLYAVSDSLKIEPVEPLVTDSIDVLSYVTIPNCCNPYDSFALEFFHDTVIGLTIFHTEVVPACDCYMQCADTVPIGKLNAGNYRLIVVNMFIDTTMLINPSYLDEIFFTVSSINNIFTLDNSGRDILIYPVPANGFIQVENVSELCYYELIDISGNVCLHGILQNNNINLSGLSNGIYIIRLTDEQHRTLKIRKIEIIQRR